MTAEATARADRMIWALARECRADDVVIVGVATPIATAAALLARALLVPDLTVIVAASVDPLPHDVAGPMLAADAVARLSVGTYTQAEVLDAISRGRVTCQFVSPAQVDGSGALNTSRVRGRDGRLRRLPGGLATADIAVLVGRLIAYRAEHSARFLPSRVDFTTGAGHADGREWRDRRGLLGSGVQAIVTDAAVLRWRDDPAGFELVELLAPGDPDQVRSAPGFAVSGSGPVPLVEPVPDDARQLLDRVIDPHRVRLLEIREGRATALDALDNLQRAAYSE